VPNKTDVAVGGENDHDQMKARKPKSKSTSDDVFDDQSGQMLTTRPVRKHKSTSDDTAVAPPAAAARLKLPRGYNFCSDDDDDDNNVVIDIGEENVPSSVSNVPTRRQKMSKVTINVVGSPVNITVRPGSVSSKHL